MFIQVIQGKTTDAAGIKRMFDRWWEDVRPGTTGFLGTTAGVAKDGTFIAHARFTDQATAQINSQRPEQNAWWGEFEKYINGQATFHDCAEVETQLAGGSDDAEFVQFIQGRCNDRQRFLQLERESMTDLQKLRPDIIGMATAWDGDWFSSACYFASEAEARKGEKAMSEQPNPSMDEWMSLISDVSYIDITSPWLRTNQ